MKFSEIGRENWDEWRPYVDTCLVPVTGLTGGEPPYEATAALERLRDVLDAVEKPYKGRVATYPALQYEWDGESFEQALRGICANLKAAGFAYVVTVSARARTGARCRGIGDLALYPEDPEAGGGLPVSRFGPALEALWTSGGDGV